MPALQVRDFPEELYQLLRERAKQQHRSISQETVIAVQRHVASQPEASTSLLSQQVYESDEIKQERLERKRAAFKRLAALPKIILPADFPSSVELVRELRDSR